MRRRALAAIGCALLALAACTGESGDGEATAAITTIEDGVLTACVAPTPGRLEEVDGGWEGSDVQVLEGLADELGLSLELTSVSFDQLVSGVALNAERCDVGAGGVVEAEGLAAVATPSAAYADVERLVVSREPASEVAPEELAGRVGVEEDGPAQDAVEALTSAEVLELPSATDLDRALISGQVDRVLVTLAGRERLAEEGTVVSRVPVADEFVLLLPLAAEEATSEAVDEALART